MGLSSRGFYATVWDVKPNTKYTDVSITVSHKDKEHEGQYIVDYSGFIRCIGQAHQAAASLRRKDRIHVTEFDVTNRYDKEKNTTYYNVAVFNLEPSSGRTQTANNNQGWADRRTPQPNFAPVFDAAPVTDTLPFD